MDGGEPEVSRRDYTSTSYYNEFSGAPSTVQPMPSNAGGDGRPHPSGPVERTLAESHGHRLVIGRDMDAYDIAPAPHGRFYIGKAQSDADAVSRWRGWLRSQGVDE